MSGDFTEGAGLERWQIAIIMAFLKAGSTGTNHERIEAMSKFFINPQELNEFAKKVVAEDA